MAPLRALLGGIGRARRSTGEILAVDSTTADVTGVRCRLNTWPGHRPGQFAFVTFDPREGAHPFTLASADRGDHTVDFQIKALGDYTRKLAGRLRPGQKVQVEGPLRPLRPGPLPPRCPPDLDCRGHRHHPPSWPGWRPCRGRPAADVPPASLHYCTRDRAADPFVARLENLCAGLPGVSLHVHGAPAGRTPRRRSAG
jgi:predicted ferric reductase